MRAVHHFAQTGLPQCRALEVVINIPQDSGFSWLTLSILQLIIAIQCYIVRS